MFSERSTPTGRGCSPGRRGTVEPRPRAETERRPASRDACRTVRHVVRARRHLGERSVGALGVVVAKHRRQRPATMSCRHVVLHIFRSQHAGELQADAATLDRLDLVPATRCIGDEQQSRRMGLGVGHARPGLLAGRVPVLPLVGHVVVDAAIDQHDSPGASQADFVEREDARRKRTRHARRCLYGRRQENLDRCRRTREAVAVHQPVREVHRRARLQFGGAQHMVNRTGRRAKVGQAHRPVAEQLTVDGVLGVQGPPTEQPPREEPADDRSCCGDRGNRPPMTDDGHGYGNERNQRHDARGDETADVAAGCRGAAQQDASVRDRRQRRSDVTFELGR